MDLLQDYSSDDEAPATYVFCAAALNKESVDRIKEIAGDATDVSTELHMTIKYWGTLKACGDQFTPNTPVVMEAKALITVPDKKLTILEVTTTEKIYDGRIPHITLHCEDKCKPGFSNWVLKGLSTDFSYTSVKGSTYAVEYCKLDGVNLTGNIKLFK